MIKKQKHKSSLLDVITAYVKSFCSKEFLRSQDRVPFLIKEVLYGFYPFICIKIAACFQTAIITVFNTAAESIGRGISPLAY